MAPPRSRGPPCTTTRRGRRVRGYHAYPRWDFIYDGARPVFISASVSPFRAHDKDSAAIYKAFEPEQRWGSHAHEVRPRTQMEALMDALRPDDAPHTSSVTPVKKRCTVTYRLGVATASGAEAELDMLYICAQPADKTTTECRYDRVAFCFAEQLLPRLRGLAPPARKKRRTD